jgi:hypothetical protein
MRSSRGWCLLGALCALGCSSGGGGGDAPIAIASGPLSGKIGGESWAFVAGDTDSFLSDDQQLFASLYAEPLGSTCGTGAPPTGRHIILNVPTQPGDYALSLTLTATFVIPRDTDTDNLGATRGRLVVDEITTSSVRGKAHVIFDAQNEVDGAFQLTRCP